MKRVIACAFALAGGLTALTACQAPDRPIQAPTCIGIVAGVRSNSLPVSRYTVDGVLPDPLPVGSVLVVTGVSGAAAGDALYQGVVRKADNSYDQKDIQLNTRNLALVAIDSAGASQPEADLLGAIEGTAKRLRPAGMECRIEVFDSGLQTAGLVTFQSGLLNVAPDAVIARIPQSSDLQGMTVVFHALGSAVAPQRSLDSTSLANLEAIWKGIVARRGGTTAAAGLTESGAVPEKSNLPPVTPVPIKDHTVDYSDITRACTGDTTTWTIPSDLLFAQGSHALSDKARQALSEPASILVGEPSARAVVTGHTSTEGGAAANLELSRQRAEAVRLALLSAAGVNADVRAEGRGESEPAVSERGKSGSELEAARSTNRRVTIRIAGIDACGEGH